MKKLTDSIKDISLRHALRDIAMVAGFWGIVIGIRFCQSKSEDTIYPPIQNTIQQDYNSALGTSS